MFRSLARACYYRYRQRSLYVRPWEDLSRHANLQNASIALVGNAGYLAELNQGDLIDGHDLVIRMNNFRTEGFEQNVGRRTDIFLTNFFTDIDYSRPELVQPSLIVSSSPNTFRKRRRRGIHLRHAPFITDGMRQLGRSTVFVPSTEWFIEQIGQIGRYPTTGAVGVLLLLKQLASVCGEIYVTGFSFFEGRCHYFNDDLANTLNHDAKRERCLIKKTICPYLDSGRMTIDESMHTSLKKSAA
jgi:Glycosyltransferase family 29 (sialyltransferase)